MRVLLIDPNEGFRREAASLMQAIPFVDGVADVGSVEQARDALAGSPPPDVVLISLAASTRPGIPGIRAIGDSPGHPRVVALTVFHEPEYVHGLRQAGAHGWLAKSDFAESVVPCLRRMLSTPDPPIPVADDHGGYP